MDCDGVLADFGKGATAVLGLAPRDFEKRHGLGRFVHHKSGGQTIEALKAWFPI